MKQVEYIACPCCGMNKVMVSPYRVGKGKAQNLEWVDFDVKTMEFIQIREGGGRGSGFHKVGALSLEDAVNKGGVYLDVARGIASQLVKATKEFKRVGLIP